MLTKRIKAIFVDKVIRIKCGWPYIEHNRFKIPKHYQYDAFGDGNNDKTMIITT